MQPLLGEGEPTPSLLTRDGTCLHTCEMFCPHQGGMAQAEADLEEGVKEGAEAEATLRLGLPSASARLARHSAAQQRGLAQM